MNAELINDGTSRDLRPPLFLWEPNDLAVFATVEDICGYIEIYDVNAFVGYDCEGRKFRLGVKTNPTIFLGLTMNRRQRVTIAEVEAKPRSADELKAILVQVLHTLGHRIDDAMTLPELIDKAVLALGITK